MQKTLAPAGTDKISSLVTMNNWGEGGNEGNEICFPARGPQEAGVESRQRVHPLSILGACRVTEG